MAGNDFEQLTRQSGSFPDQLVSWREGRFLLKRTSAATGDGKSAIDILEPLLDGNSDSPEIDQANELLAGLRLLLRLRQ